MIKNQVCHEIHKKVGIGQHFWFCFIWVAWRRCLVSPWHMTLYLDFLFFIFAIVSNLQVLTKNSYHKNLSSLLVLCWGAIKNCHHCSDGSFPAIHYDSYFFCNKPFWKLLLHLQVAPPKQQCWLVCLLLRVEKRLLNQLCLPLCSV